MRGMRNGKRQTSYDRAREILKQAAYGVLSTSCEDGLPYGVPLCHVLTGNSIYFHCAAEGQKLDNLMRDGRACLTVVSAAKNLGNRLSMAYESAMAFGVVRLVYGEDERLAAMRLLMAPLLNSSSGDDVGRTKSESSASGFVPYFVTATTQA